MQILAFDYGTKHIGIAVGQTITRTSSPLMILNVQQEGPDIWQTIFQLVEEWKPDRLLVGQPLNMDGTPSEMMKKVNKFYIKLQQETNIICELVDERLTSFEAKQLTESDLKEVRIDDLAAKIILDSWMEQNVHS
jgi:putative holliday junction resolvase|tara:strand:- start:336 stop:740 length:405 start_codon:yes stop_codon:yes gene_type:complete